VNLIKYKNYYFIKTLVLFFLLLFVSFFSLIYGYYDITISDIKSFFLNQDISSEKLIIIKEIRLPRVVLGFLCASILSISGLLLQSVFKNPLVDPFILGISGTSSLGAGIGIILNKNFLSFNSTFLLSFLFCIIGLIISYKLSIVNGNFVIERMLLSGIAISSLSSSILSLLFVLNSKDSNNILLWIMGNLSGKTFDDFIFLIPLFVISIFLIIPKLYRLNLIQLGEESSINIGINLNIEKIYIVTIVSLLTSITVSLTGIIGFIGLVVPQISRFFIKINDYRLLFLPVILIGSIILILSDILSRTLIDGQEIPIGIFTSILGVPFFLYQLKKK
jgi:iron complex transport system permease protein